MSRRPQRSIDVWADWVGLDGPTFMGTLFATLSRGIAKTVGISRDEQERMAPAFDHVRA